MKRIYWVVAIFAALSPAVYGQTVLVNEQFNYADEAALHAVWGGLSGTGAIAGTPQQVEERFQLVTEPGGTNVDFNGDGTVDTADYVVWRKNNGTQDEYNAWRAQFGGPPTGGGGGNTYLNHLANNNPPNLPDGSVVYKPLLDPNFVPPGYEGGDGSIFPSAGMEPIVLRGDIFTPSSAIQRNTVGLRYFDGTVTQNLFEMGVYNDGAALPAANPPGTTGAAAPGTTDSQNRAFAAFAIRAQLFQLQSDANPNWQYFALAPAWDTNANGLTTASEAFTALGITGTGGWHTLEATFAPKEGGAPGDITLTATLDLLRDGLNNATNEPGVDGTITVTNLRVTQSGFNSLRLGGPSALATTLAMGFDNIELTGPKVAPMGLGSGAAVPEPSAIALSMLAAMSLFGLSARRRS
jgi:PEP-CTERM motif